MSSATRLKLAKLKLKALSKQLGNTSKRLQRATENNWQGEWQMCDSCGFKHRIDPKPTAKGVAKFDLESDLYNKQANEYWELKDYVDSLTVVVRYES